MVAKLLDFGTSFWESERVLEELPGLLGSAYESTGRFGIGFFSVFMWGDTVTVTSRKHSAARADTHVLEFSDGVSRRPLLRAARPEEQLVDPGTRVCVRLDDDTLWRLGLEPAEGAGALGRLCAWIAPALDVNLHVEVNDERLTPISANDWQRMPIEELGARLRGTPTRHGRRPGYTEAAEPGEGDAAAAIDAEAEVDTDEEVVAGVALEGRSPLPVELCGHARPLVRHDGTVVGRALLNPFDYVGGVVTVGGLRSANLHKMTGVLIGRPTTASRHVGMPIVPAEILAAWATEQATLLAGKLSTEELFEAAQYVRAYGGDPGPLPIATTRQGTMTRDALRAWATDRDEVLLVYEEGLGAARLGRPAIDFHDNVAVAAAFTPHLLEPSLGTARDPGSDWPNPSRATMHYQSSLVGLGLETVAESWGIARSDLAASAVEVRSQTVGWSDREVPALLTIALRRPGP